MEDAGRDVRSGPVPNRRWPGAAKVSQGLEDGVTLPKHFAPAGRM